MRYAGLSGKPTETVSHRSRREVSQHGERDVNIGLRKVEIAGHPRKVYSRLASLRQKKSPRQRRPHSVASRLSPSQKKILRTSRGHTFSGNIFNAAFRAQNCKNDQTSDNLKGYVTDEECSLDRVFFFANRKYKLSATVGRVGAVSFLVSTVLDTGAGPSLIHKRKIDPA